MAGVLVVTDMWVMVSMATRRDGLMIDVAVVGDVTPAGHVVVVMVRGFGRRGVMIGVRRVIQLFLRVLGVRRTLGHRDRLAEPSHRYPARVYHI